MCYERDYIYRIAGNFRGCKIVRNCIFAVLIFTAPTRTGRRAAIDIALAAIFAVFIFTEANLSANREILQHAKISRYTVPSCLHA